MLDIVLGTVFMGIAFSSSLFVIRNLLDTTYHMEALLRADSMANCIMEVIRAHRFDENTAEPWGSTVGPEEGSYDNFDDVDDFIGYSWSLPGYAGFSASSRIYYINPDVSLDDSTDTPTSYKKIIIQVKNAVLTNGVEHSSLITASGG